MTVKSLMYIYKKISFYYKRSIIVKQSSRATASAGPPTRFLTSSQSVKPVDATQTIKARSVDSSRCSKRVFRNHSQYISPHIRLTPFSRGPPVIARAHIYTHRRTPRSREPSRAWLFTWSQYIYSSPCAIWSSGGGGRVGHIVIVDVVTGK